MKNTGGPAFPNEGFNGWGEPQQGMTLRDYFAAQCMFGLNKNIVDYGWDDEVLDGYAKQAYKIADAMMRARGSQ